MRLAIAHQHQHFIERDGLACLGRKLLDRDDVLGGDPVLLAAGLDDCEHRFCPRVQSSLPAVPTRSEADANGRLFVTVSPLAHFTGMKTSALPSIRATMALKVVDAKTNAQPMKAAREAVCL